ncbi:MAG: hypothetical protein M3014_07070 [Chloroflexota bacterium]|nr:hypothetical protein [Chloroflexota bacterium]
MNNSAGGLNAVTELWEKARQRPAPVAAVVLLVTLFIALAGYPLVWLVGGAIVLALLWPMLFGAARGGAGIQPSPSLTPQPPVLALDKLRGHYLDQMRNVLATRRKIEEAISQTDDAGQRQVLANATKFLPDLTDSIYRLSLKAQSVQSEMGEPGLAGSAVMGGGPMQELTGEIKRLEAAIQGTNDEFQKSQYYAALDGKLQQMQNMADTTVAVRRWDAQIENAVSTLDTLLSQVLRIKSSEVLSYSGVGSSGQDELSNSLKREVDSLKAAAEAMDTVYGWQKKS